MVRASSWALVSMLALATLLAELLWPFTQVRAGSPERQPLQELVTPTAALPEDAAAWRRLDDALSADYPLHGVAFHWLAQVFAQPSERSPVVGYMRRGSTLRAQAGVRGKGCETLWHAVLGGGYVCAGRGFLLGETPQRFPAAAPPQLYEPLPYRYAKAAVANTPVFFRAPLPEEERELGAKLNQAQKLAVTPLLAADAPAPARLPARPPSLTAARTGARPAPAAAGGKTASPLPAPVVLPEVVRMLLQPGFYVSLDRTPAAAEPESVFARTVRGDFVRDAGERPVVPSTLHGTVLSSEGRSRAIALITRAHVPSFRRDVLRGVLVRDGEFEQMEPVQLADETLRSGKSSYRVLADGRIVQEDALRILPQIERPKVIPRQARWVAVSLSTQTLIAFEGEIPVYATLVSTGKTGHETPTGLFRISSKHVSATMDGEAGTDEAYSIEDVPWVMYFSGSIALHAAFWHERFGRTRSHGCVNLAPLDARWLFDWTEPHLPAGFHGVEGGGVEQPGTIVAVLP